MTTPAPQPEAEKKHDFYLYLNGKEFCPIHRLADSGLHQQVLQFGSAEPLENKKVLIMVTAKEPAVAMGRSYSIYIPDYDRHIPIDISHCQREGNSYVSMCVRG